MADLNELTKIEDKTAEFDQEDINKNQVISIFAYISWLVLIPIFCAKDSKYARFHANQGLVLAIAETALNIVGRILLIIPIIGWIINIVIWIADVALFVLTIIGLVAVFNKQAKTLPVIGKFQILK